MLLPILRRCGRFLRCERAVSALEYAILAGVVIAGVGGAIVLFADSIGDSIAGLGTKVGEGAGSVSKAELQKPTD